MPKCIRSKEREYVHLPSFEMCRVTSEPCRILYETELFSQNLRCNEQVFPCKNCTNDVRDMKFNATGQCMPPLVSTESSINHYPGKFVFSMKLSHYCSSKNKTFPIFFYNGVQFI